MLTTNGYLPQCKSITAIFISTYGKLWHRVQDLTDSFIIVHIFKLRPRRSQKLLYVRQLDSITSFKSAEFGEKNNGTLNITETDKQKIM